MSGSHGAGKPPEFVVGLDLGQSADYTALSVLRKTTFEPEGGAGRRANRYAVVHMHRFDLGCPYPKIVRDVGELLARPELRPPTVAASLPPEFRAARAIDTPHGRYWLADGPDVATDPHRPKEPLLVVDATGVGRAIVDIFIESKMPCRLVPLTITGGDQARRDGWPGTPEGAWWTPKRELVGTVQSLLQRGLLNVVPSLPLADVLRAELLDFKVKISAAANESFNAREGAHDDLLLSVAVAAWVGELPTPSYKPIDW